jgi:NAD(P)-dependent dehydrogenase (short-subunit alcohol dehydrogenase family)
MCWGLAGNLAKMSFFTDKHFVVTGAGRGIGRATAQMLVDEGAKVHCFDLAADRLRRAVDAMEGPGSACAVVVDISDEESVADGYRRVSEKSGGMLSGLAHCAAIGRARPFEEMTWEDWEVELKVNLFGTYVMTKYAAALMRAAGGGRIVNIASNAAKVPGPYSAPYNASKAAVISLTRSSAKALAPDIAVNSICPGHVDTPMRSDFGEEAGKLVGGVDLDAAAATAQLGRPALPEEIASAVLFLLSPASVFVNGEDLNVNGGIVMY